MIETDVLIFGSGSLARSLVMALAARPQPSLSVIIAGRRETILDSIVLLARARAAALGSELSITSVACDYTEATLDALFMKIRPRIVLTLASRQSPWTMAPRWRQLVNAVGYGLTLPFQAALADMVFRASQRSHPAGFRVNGCYPMK
jgi:NAD(P)-dependent dehydrogenase (short-subunit alcohol dehydrogenase family)